MIKVLVNNSPTKVRVFFVTAKHSHIFFRIFFLQGSPASFLPLSSRARSTSGRLLLKGRKKSRDLLKRAKPLCFVHFF